MKKQTIMWIVIILIIAIGLILIIINLNKEPLIGGCAGVASEYTQECCQKLADDNLIIQANCVGRWVIEDNECKWECTPTTKEGCIEKGGYWGTIGPDPEEGCNLPTRDANKVCTDGPQCESNSCIGEDEDSTSGKCAGAMIVVGCNLEFFDGKASLICRD